MEPEVVNPDREASATVRGFLAQGVHAARRWLDLEPTQVLICEGSEDIDILSPELNQLTLEQVKELSKRISARQAAVYETIFHFAENYVHFTRQAQKVRLVFTTCAGLAAQKTDSLDESAKLDVNVLKVWSSPDSDDKVDELKKACKELLRHAKDKELIAKDAAARAQSAFDFLDEEDWWSGFFGSVDWNTDSPDLDTALAQLRADAFSRYNLKRVLADRLLWEVLWAMGRTRLDERKLTQEHLDAVIHAVRAELANWASSAEGVRFYSVLKALVAAHAAVGDGVENFAISVGVQGDAVQVRASGKGLVTFQFHDTEAGTKAREIVKQALASGVVQEIPAGGVEMMIAPSVVEHFPVLALKVAQRTWVVPGLAGRTTPVKFGVKKKLKHWNLERYVRKFNSLPDVRDALLTVLRDGSAAKEFRIALDSMGLTFDLELVNVDGDWAPGALKFQREYVGLPVELAAMAEELVEVVHEGCFAATFAKDQRLLAWETNGEGEEFERWGAPFGILAALAEASGAVISVPERIDEIELLRATSLIELLTQDRRPLGGGTLSFVVEEPAQLTNLLQHLEHRHAPSFFEFMLPPKVVEVLDGRIDLPARKVQINNPIIRDAEAIVNAGPSDLPLNVVVCWNEDEAVETVLERQST